MGNDKPVALVTGAGRDIIHEPENKRSGLFEVKERVEELGASFLPLQGNVSSLEDQETILRQALDKWKKIDVLVNNAGVAPERRVDVLKTTPESYDRLQSVNARGPFFLTQKIAKQMIKQVKENPDSRPCVIFISSISASVSSPTRAEYCVSKAALSQAARVFADRLSEYGINVYEVRPGIILTDMTAPVKEKYDKLIAGGLIPQKRWGLPEDVGKAVAALAKGYFGYSTGLVVEVSGGMNIQRL